MMRFSTRLVLAALLVGSVGGASVASAQVRQGFRVNLLKVVDPNIMIDALGFGSCSNITNTPLLGISVNNLVRDFIDECEPVAEGPAAPCTNGFNLVAVFDPLDQTAGPDGALQECMSGGNPCTFTVGLVDSCTRENGAVECDGDFSNGSITTYSSAGAGVECIGALAGTTGPNNNGNYNPPVVATDGPCGVSGQIDLTLELGSDFVITIPLKGLELGAQYEGDPALGLIKGLARGFVPESAADAIKLDLAELSGGLLQASRTLAQLLPGPDKCDGGMNHGDACASIVDCPANPSDPQPQCVAGRCDGGANADLSCLTADNCPATLCRISCAPAGGAATGTRQDDRDQGPDGEPGWWFYLSFAAEPVDVSEPPAPTPTPTEAVPPTATPTPVPTATDTATPVPTATDTATPVPTPTPTPTPGPCSGDCNGDRDVSIAEVQTAANVFLGKNAVSVCAAADTNANGTVSIAEVMQAANSFQVGCP